MTKPTDLKAISDATATDDGQSASLTIETEDGSKLKVTLDAKVLHKTIEDLTYFARCVAEIRTKGKPVPLEKDVPTNISNTEVSEIGLGLGNDRKSIFLILRILDFDLGYQLTTTELRSLAESFREMALALDADESKQN